AARLASLRRISGTALLRSGSRSPLEPLCDIDDIDECCAELLPYGGKGIPDCWWRGWFCRSFDNPLVFQFAKTIREHLGRDSSDVDLKLCKATLAFTQIPELMLRPGPRKHTHALAERTSSRRWRNLALASLHDSETTYQLVTRFYMQVPECRILSRSIF